LLGRRNQKGQGRRVRAVTSGELLGIPKTRKKMFEKKMREKGVKCP